jgi:hypothetical protein
MIFAQVALAPNHIYFIKYMWLGASATWAKIMKHTFAVVAF